VPGGGDAGLGHGVGFIKIGCGLDERGEPAGGRRFWIAAGGELGKQRQLPDRGLLRVDEWRASLPKLAADGANCSPDCRSRCSLGVDPAPPPGCSYYDCFEFFGWIACRGQRDGFG